MKKFAASIPRRMYWSDSVADRVYCPECRAQLENESHVYVMVIRDAHDFHPFIVGTDAGYFCPACPTLVLYREEFRNLAVAVYGHDARAEFTVLGIVDLEAIPEEMRNVPLGEDGNPVPLVEFIRKTGTHSKRQNKANLEKKRRRAKKSQRR